MKYRDPFDLPAQRPAIEPVRSMFLDAPSGNVLHEIGPRDRAVFVLLQVGEDPGLVGRSILRAPKAGAAKRALEVADRVAAETFIERNSSPRAVALQEIIPDRRHRWALLLRASNAFPTFDDVAPLLRADRATVYRHLAAAKSALTRELQRRKSA